MRLHRWISSLCDVQCTSGRTVLSWMTVIFHFDVSIFPLSCLCYLNCALWCYILRWICLLEHVFLVESWHRVALYLSFWLWDPAVLKIITKLFFFFLSHFPSLWKMMSLLCLTLSGYLKRRESFSVFVDIWSSANNTICCTCVKIYYIVSSVFQNKMCYFWLKLVFKLIYF